MCPQLLSRFTYFLTAAMLAVMGCLAVDPVQAQSNGRDRRQITVGDLVGRTDYRQIKILTKQGYLTVTGEGNGKPFSILKQTPTLLVLQFYRSLGVGDFNPNRVVNRLFETERALISALILEEVDFAVLDSEASAMEVRKSNIHILPLPVPTDRNKAKLVMYNHDHEFFSSSELRQALSYGINHDHILKKIIKGGKATIARGPFDDNSPIYNTGMKSYKYDPRLALQILAQQGWRDADKDGIIERAGKPFVIELLYQKGLRLDEAISRSIKIDLIKLGIDVNPKPLSRHELNNRLSSGNFDAALLDHVFPETAEGLKDFFGLESRHNYMNYHSAKFERYLRFYESAKEASRKEKLMKTMQSVLNQEQPVTFLYFKWLTHYLVNVEKFENFRYTDGPNRGKIRPFEEWKYKRFKQP